MARPPSYRAYYKLAGANGLVSLSDSSIEGETKHHDMDNDDVQFTRERGVADRRLQRRVLELKHAGEPNDYIFASTDVSVERLEVDRAMNEGRYPSDHYPVRAVLSKA